jgi:hypothetical protein
VRLIIDAHGHYTTVPAGLRVFRAALNSLTEEDRKKIFEDNARKAYPRVAQILAQRTKEKVGNA